MPTWSRLGLGVLTMVGCGLVPFPALAQDPNLVQMAAVDVGGSPTVGTVGEMSDIWVVSPTAYIGGRNGGPTEEGLVYVYDYTDPTAPVERVACRLTLPDEVNDVAVESHYLYVPLQRDVDNQPGLYVYDMTDASSPTCPPPAPTIVTDVPSAHNLLFATVGGSRYLFLATLDPLARKGVYVFDVADPGNPAKIGPPGPAPTWDYDPPPNCPTCGPHDVFAKEIGGVPYQFVATLFDGFYILDITDPAAPTVRSH